MIKFTCPNCNKALKASPEAAGKKATCSKCKHAIKVPKEPQKAQKPTTIVELQQLETSEVQPKDFPMQGPVPSPLHKNPLLYAVVILCILLIASLVCNIILLMRPSTAALPVTVVKQVDEAKEAEKKLKRLLSYKLDRVSKWSWEWGEDHSIFKKKDGSWGSIMIVHILNGYGGKTKYKIFADMKQNTLTKAVLSGGSGDKLTHQSIL